MRTNVLPPSVPIVAAGAAGPGFGLDLAVYIDWIAAGGYYGKGTFWWGGAAGTWFWIDPVNDLIVAGMIQLATGSSDAEVAAVRDVSRLSHALIYQALLH